MVVAVLAAALVASHQAGRPDLAGHDNAQYHRLSLAQAGPCLIARGLHVTPASARSLHVTGAAQLDATLTFYATTAQAQAVAGRWQSTPYGVHHPLQRTAFDNVAVGWSSLISDHDVRLLGGCIGWQPVRAGA
jgi:hypothetical protein